MKKYISSTEVLGRKFYEDFHQKSTIVMMNLLRFREKADYSEFEHLAPGEPVSGEEAYRLYMKFTLPEIEKAGSKVLFYGSCNHFLIGPESEQWDAMLLVEHRSVDSFIQFARNENYLRTAGHRTAALDDSRLLPLSPSITELHDIFGAHPNKEQK